MVARCVCRQRGTDVRLALALIALIGCRGKTHRRAIVAESQVAQGDSTITNTAEAIAALARMEARQLLIDGDRDDTQLRHIRSIADGANCPRQAF